jgi:hypothetical protein
MLDKYLKNKKFKSLENQEPCIYNYKEEGRDVTMAIFVDDIAIAAPKNDMNWAPLLWQLAPKSLNQKRII